MLERLVRVTTVMSEHSMALLCCLCFLIPLALTVTELKKYRKHGITDMSGLPHTLREKLRPHMQHIVCTQ